MTQVNLQTVDSVSHSSEDSQEENLTPAQRLHRQFNEAAARVDALKRLIEMRIAMGEDFSRLWKMLEQSEAEKKRAHAGLAHAGRFKLVSRVGAPQ